MPRVPAFCSEAPHSVYHTHSIDMVNYRFYTVFTGLLWFKLPITLYNRLDIKRSTVSYNHVTTSQMSKHLWLSVMTIRRISFLKSTPIFHSEQTILSLRADDLLLRDHSVTVSIIYAISSEGQQIKKRRKNNN